MTDKPTPATDAMLEKVAQAIYEQRPRLIQSQMSAVRGSGAVPWEHAPQRWKRVAMKQARAAITAMQPRIADEQVTEVLRDVQACFWVGRVELQGKQEYVTRTWEKVKALNKVLAATPALAPGEALTEFLASDPPVHEIVGAPDDESMLTPEETDELVARINADPNIRPLPRAAGDEDAEWLQQMAHEIRKCGDALKPEFSISLTDGLERIATRLNGDGLLQFAVDHLSNDSFHGDAIDYFFGEAKRLLAKPRAAESAKEGGK